MSKTGINRSIKHFKVVSSVISASKKLVTFWQKREYKNCDCVLGLFWELQSNIVLFVACRWTVCRKLYSDHRKTVNPPTWKSLFCWTTHAAHEVRDTSVSSAGSYTAQHSPSRMFHCGCLRHAGQVNSRTMLLPLLQHFTSQMRVSLYHTPDLRGLLRLLVPQRFNETIGVQHIKVYLFDDSIIISG